MKYLDKLFNNYEDSIEESKPGRTSFDYDAQDAAKRGALGKEVQKSKRATSDAGSGISRRLKSGEKPKYRGQKLTYDHTEYRRIGALMAEALGLTPQQMKHRKYYDDAMKNPKSRLAQASAEKRRRAATSMPSKGTMGRRDDNDGLGKKRVDRIKDMEESRGAKSPAELFPGMTARPVDTRGAGTRKKPMSLPQQQRLRPLKHSHPDHKKASREDSHTVYKQIGMTLAEAVTKKVGPIASRYSGMGRVESKKKGEGSRSIGDPVVRKAVSDANKRVGQKLGIKANLPTDVAAQQGLENRRRRFRRKGIGLPAMTRKERQADALADKNRLKGPDDE